MSYTLIKGTFIIFYPGVKASGQPKPDGDTIKFSPSNPQTLSTLKRVPGRCIDLGADWKINIRFEGIDTLELHYPFTKKDNEQLAGVLSAESDVSSGDYRQELTLATQARNRMLELLGFGNPQFNEPDPDACPIEDSTAFSAIDPAIPEVNGYILARDVDSYGRVIAFVFSGEHDSEDGSSIHVIPSDIEASINATLLSEGLAYPTIYTSMPPDLRPVFVEIADSARTQNLGVWEIATATPTQPATITNICDLQPLSIWPKLFRRLVTYFGSGYEGLSQFDVWLRADGLERDDKMLLPNGDLGNMHDMVEVQGNQIRTVFQPELVTIEPDEPVARIVPITVQRYKRDVRIVAALVKPVENEELITLVNCLPFEVDLTGWKLKTVSPKGREKIQTLNGSMMPGAVLQIIWSTGGLSNEGSEIQLANVKGDLLDAVVYTKSQASCAGQTIIF